MSPNPNGSGPRLFPVRQGSAPGYRLIARRGRPSGGLRPQKARAHHIPASRLGAAEIPKLTINSMPRLILQRTPPARDLRELEFSAFFWPDDRVGRGLAAERNLSSGDGAPAPCGRAEKRRRENGRCGRLHFHNPGRSYGINHGFFYRARISRPVGIGSCFPVRRPLARNPRGQSFLRNFPFLSGLA